MAKKLSILLRSGGQSYPVRPFRDAAKGARVSDNIGPSLYKHFSSGAAYVLYPDVEPFLQRMHRLRRALDTGTSEDPMLIIGVIANSDQGVRRVLQSIGLSVGTSEDPDKMSYWSAFRFGMTTGLSNFRTPFLDIWSSRHDFDFLATSYEKGYQKPHSHIYSLSYTLACANVLSHAEQLKHMIGAPPSKVIKPRKLGGSQSSQRGRLGLDPCWN